MAAMNVAFLRGVNVGRGKRVAMADLRTLVESLGYCDVRTLLNSGNIVFSVPKGAQGDPAARIEKAITAKLGISSRVTVMTADEVAVAVDDNPLGEVADHPSRLLVMVFRDSEARSQLKQLSRQSWAPEALALGKRVAYLWCPHGIIDSRLMLAVSRLLGDRGTARNMATMTKLHLLTRGK